MKFWTIAIAILAVASFAAASDRDKDHNKGHQCVPEPVSMLALAPGAVMLLRRRNKKA